MVQWRDRIVGHGKLAPDEILPHPENWRRHPTIQRRVLAVLLEELGTIQTVVINKRLGPAWPQGKRYVETLIDGHLRVDLAIEYGEKEIDVTFVDLDPEEEAAALALFDSVGRLGGVNPKQFDALLAAAKATHAEIEHDLDELRWTLLGKPIDTVQYGEDDRGLSTEEKKARYDQNPMRQIVLHLLPDEYREISGMLEELQDHFGLETNAQVVAHLIRERATETEEEE